MNTNNGVNEVATTRYNTPSGWTGNTTTKVSRLGTTAGHNTGPNTLQKVMAGDKITASVQYYHQGSAGGNNTNFLSTVVASLTQAISGGTAATQIVHDNAGNITTQLSGLPDFGNAVQPNGSNPSGNAPQAWLTILFFDERFNFIPAADGGVAQLQVAASVGSNGDVLALSNSKAPKNGYAYVYVSNQSNNDVYFDNLQVQVTGGNIIEENHYYAYGLRIATLSSRKLGDGYEGTLKNNYLYNDKELFDDADLNWYDYGFRNYDPQIGRFPQLDPLTFNYPNYTPYQYAGDEPITNIDIDGLEPGNTVEQSFTKIMAATANEAGTPLENLVLKPAHRVITPALKPVLPTATLVKITTNSLTNGAMLASHYLRGPSENSVGAQVRQMQVNAEARITEQVARLTPPTISSCTCPNLSGTKDPNADPYVYQLRKERIQKISERAGSVPLVSNLVRAGSMEMNGFHAEAWNSFKRGSVELGLTYFGGMFVEEFAAGYAAGGGATVGSASAETTVYRVYGGDSGPYGSSWTPINPNTVPNYRNVAGLPNGNTGRFVIEGTIKNSEIKVIKFADPLDGNKGGLLEYKLDGTKVNIKRVSGVNPQF